MTLLVRMGDDTIAKNESEGGMTLSQVIMLNRNKGPTFWKMKSLEVVFIHTFY